VNESRRPRGGHTTARTARSTHVTILTDVFASHFNADLERRLEVRLALAIRTRSDGAAARVDSDADADLVHGGDRSQVAVGGAIDVEVHVDDAVLRAPLAGFCPQDLRLGLCGGRRSCGRRRSGASNREEEERRRKERSRLSPGTCMRAWYPTKCDA